MPKFRKKPVVIEARQWNGLRNSALEITDWIGAGDFVPADGHFDLTPTLIIPTLEDGKRGQAKHIASPGDWIIKGVKGEFYACKPDIFALTYELVEDAHDAS